MVTKRMNRCCRISLLSAALCTALPLYAGTPADPVGDTSDAVVAADAAPTELATVRVNARAAEKPGTAFNAFGAGDWKDTPASLAVLDRSVLDGLRVRSVSELARRDASLGDSYAPVGYYQNLAIRGFALDTASGYRFNGMSIAGEQRLALEHVQQVEILKGEAGLAAGVIAPGGLVNYVGKRPAELRTLTLGTDSEGSRYAAIDVGHWLTPRIGLRFNAAWEDAASYIEHADGRRHFYALASDWLIGERGKLEVDANYQTSAQRSASGYQLLGGRVIPQRVDRRQLLGYQPWQRPVQIDSTNITATHTYDFSAQWQSRIAASYSRSVIDDNVTFAYGCYYAPACWDGGVPGNAFGPDGEYDIYDYRSPDDNRRNQQLRAELHGRLATGSVAHELTLGVDRFERRIDRHRNVNEYVGGGNIHDPAVPVYTPSPLQPGPSVRRLDSAQDALLMLDRLQLSPRWEWLAGGRFVRLDETARDKRGNVERDSTLSRFLPQTALVFRASDRLTLYASHVQGISLGQEAPFWTSNEGSYLPAVRSRQLELGAKYTNGDALALSAALFRISRPLQYARPDDSDAGYTFVEQGQQVHTGLELGARGMLGEHLRVTASASLLRARAQHSGTAAYEGHALINVPERRASVLLDYSLPTLPALGLTGGWRHASANTATMDGRVRAPGYHVFDAGLRYRHALGGRALDWSLSVDNVFDRFYWRDTGGVDGDYYLFPGAPRQARLTLTVAL